MILTAFKLKFNSKQGFCHCWVTTSPLQMLHLPFPLIPQILQIHLPHLNLFLVLVTEQQQLFNFVYFTYPMNLPDARGGK